MRRHAKWYAIGTVAALVTVLWPGQAASADPQTTLGGYDATATASAIRVQIIDPSLPLPDPEAGVDLNLSFARASASTGSSKATASYVWPGDAIALGLGQMLNQPDFKYPIQVNSAYQPLPDAPAQQSQQLFDGTGMATNTDGTHTKATVSALGIGPTGAPTAAQNQAGTVPTPDLFANMVAIHNGTATSTVDLSDKAVTARAYTAASSIDLLSGLIRIEGISAESTVTSDGTKAVVDGKASLGAITIAGLRFSLGDTIGLGPTGIQLPNFGALTNGILKMFGLSFDTPTVTKKVDGATGTVESSLLRLTIDTKPLKSLISSPLNMLMSLLGSNAPKELQLLVNLAPKIVLTFGDSIVTTTASPPFDLGEDDGSGSTPPVTDTGTSDGDQGVTDAGSGVDDMAVGGGDQNYGGDSLGAAAVGGGSGGGSAPGTGGGSGVGGEASGPATQPAAFSLPGLGSVPRLLILGGLLLAGLVGWALRMVGGSVLGGAAACDFGLTTGVPDLRKA